MQHPDNCTICKRNVETRDYAFGMKPSHFDFSLGKEIENPDYISIKVCKTDQNLLSQVKSKNPTLTARELIDRAIAFRLSRPVQEKTRIESSIKPNPAESSVCFYCGIPKETTNAFLGTRECRNPDCAGKILGRV